MRFIAASLLLAFVSGANPAQPPPPFAQRFQQIRDAATPDELYRFLWALPKGGDIHNHHEYSVPPEEWLRLAARGSAKYLVRTGLTPCGPVGADLPQFVTLRTATVQALPSCVEKDFTPLATLTPPQRAAWLSALRLDRPGEGRDEFFNRLVLRTADLENDPALVTDLLVYQLRQAAAENITYLETQADPRGFVRPDGSPMPWAESAALFRRRLAQPDAIATRVATRLQVAVLRFSPTAQQSLADAFRFVHQSRDLWVAVNLVGREDIPAGRATRFTASFRDLRRRYPDVRLSLHAGESDRPGFEVRDTLALGAERIGHGVNLISDPSTMRRLSGGRTLIEVSLVSNQLLGYVPDPARHPFPHYLRAGIPVCLNTDDRGAYDSNLTDEYFLALTHFHLSWPELVQLGRDSLKYSFAEPALKSALLARYERNIASFQARFDTPDWRTEIRSIHPVVSGYAARFLPLSRHDMISPRN
ncbi:MAG TPA: hypothetical protein VGK29_05855 [Paludibaculum sp.]